LEEVFSWGFPQFIILKENIGKYSKHGCPGIFSVPCFDNENASN
jgi:hypothetical protein